MTVATAPGRMATLTAEYINPVIAATRSVFEMMLDCQPQRRALRLKSPDEDSCDVSAVIGITGKAKGTIVVGLSEDTACAVLERMVGSQATTINAEVCDAVGELTNMIAGSAKAQLAQYDLSISLPNVISGRSYRMHSPADVQAMVIEFDSEIGPLTIEVAFVAV